MKGLSIIDKGSITSLPGLITSLGFWGYLESAKNVVFIPKWIIIRNKCRLQASASITYFFNRGPLALANYRINPIYSQGLDSLLLSFSFSLCCLQVSRSLPDF